MRNLFLFGILICLCIPAQAQIKKSDVSVLYVGGTSDMNTSTMTVDSVMLAKDIQTRMASFEDMLKEYFKTVKVIRAQDYVVNLSDNYDVTIFDGMLPQIEPFKYIYAKDGSIEGIVQPRFLPYDFDRPAIMLVQMGSTLGGRNGLKTDCCCLCLDADAHHFRAEHPIFHTPFPVKMTVRMEPTPESAYHYLYYADGALPDSIFMWKVQIKGYMEDEKFRIGMVSRPWGFEDSPDAEYISGGVSQKTLDAVAIGRHGNFLHWGFSASPRYMTEEAKTVFANAVVYISQFAGQTPIARKHNAFIATRDNIKELKYIASRKGWEEDVKMAEKHTAEMLDRKKKIEEKLAKGDSLTQEEQYLLRYKPKAPASYEETLKRFQGNLFEQFGTDEQAYMKYYDENFDYFYGGEGDYNLVVDEDVKSWGIPNNDIRLLDKAISEWEKGGDIAKTRRVLERYTLCRFDTPEEWREWYETNKNKIFFTESGGWLFMVNTYDPNIPGNDYSVRNQKKTAPAAAQLATDAKNPVQAALSIENAANGNRIAVLRVKVHPGYHIYATVGKTDPFVPTEVSFSLPVTWETVGDLQIPSFEGYNSTGTTIYEGDLVFRQELKGNGIDTVHCTVSYQCCDAHICFPPTEIKCTAEIK